MLVALDFESEAIDTRPNYPPTPVGLAVYVDGDPPYYMAWGHPTQNNITYTRARERLEGLLSSPMSEFIFHNAPFDCAIIEEKMGLTVPWERVHDTMLAAFLLNPFGELSLKPLAEFYLGEAPTERDAVRDWLVANGVCRALDKSWGAHISKAPGDIVGPYAIGDVRKTMGLYKLFKAKIEQKTPVITQKEQMLRQVLKDKISTAIAWGVPDNESTGMSQSELVSLLAQAKKELP